MNELVVLFDNIIDAAPVDFLGTGESYKWANQQEAEWQEMVDQLREKLLRLDK